jgi:hypothetical protein
MATQDAVGRFYPDSFGNFAIAAGRVSVAATGNAVVAIPFFGGGLTNGGAVANSGSVIIRRVTIQNPNAVLSSANISVTISPTGNMATGNAITANTVLSNLTVLGVTWQDIAVVAPYLSNTSVSGNTTQAVYVNVNTAVANGAFDIRVYGEAVNF